MINKLTVFSVIYFDFYICMKIDLPFIVSNINLLWRIESESFSPYLFCLGTFSSFCDIIKTKNHVLRWNGYWSTVCRVKDIMRSQHKHLGFKYCPVAKWKMHSHLVTVKVSVKGCTDKWMELDCFSFN